MVDTLAKSHLQVSSTTQCGAAECAATAKEAKYTPLIGTYAFAPIAFETLGVINSSAVALLDELGRRLSLVTDDTRERSFLYQRLPVTLQRFNAISFRGSFIHPSFPDS